LVFNSALSGRHKFNAANLAELAVASLRVLIFAAYFLGKNSYFVISVRSVFTADLALTLLRAGLFFVCYGREFGFRIHLSLQGAVRPVLGFSILIYVSYLINFLYLRADYWIIERQLGLKELGIYSVAAGLAQFLTFIPLTLNTVMLPHLSSAGRTEALGKLGMFSRLNASALGLITSVLVIFAGPVIRLCYGAAFQGAVMPLRIVSISFLLLSLKHLFAYYNLSQDRARHNITAEVLGLIVGLSGDFILIPRFGILGASYASATANLISLSYVFVGIMQTGKVRYFELFILKLQDVNNLVSSVFQPSPKESPV
jgi:O-antigen/teichoic acid export membrane protein